MPRSASSNLYECKARASDTCRAGRAGRAGARRLSEPGGGRGCPLRRNSWAPQLLRELSIPLVVRRKPQFWYPADAAYSVDRGCPAYLFDLPDGIFYGIPQVDEYGLKVAEHTGGELVADRGDCTACSDEWFSHRARGEGERQATIVIAAPA